MYFVLTKSLVKMPKRDYLLIIKESDSDKPIDYCRSNTYRGCLNYLQFHSVWSVLVEKGSLTFEIIRNTYGETESPAIIP